MNLSKTQRKAAIATETVTTLAVLTALAIICSTFLTFRFGVNFIKLSPTFIVIALAARRYGVFGAATVAFMSDLIQYLFQPTNGFSIGICLSGVLTGVILGLFFYKKINLTRIVIAIVTSQLVCSVGITTFTMVYIERWYPLVPLIYSRLAQAGVMTVISIITLYYLFVKIDLAKLTKIVK